MNLKVVFKELIEKLKGKHVPIAKNRRRYDRKSEDCSCICHGTVIKEVQ